MTETRRAAWVEVELGDIVTLHRGYDLPTGQRREGSIPVVSSSGITGYHDEAKIDPPGVVTGRYGTLGEVFFIDRPFWPLNTTLYVSDFHGNIPRFVSYLLECQGFGSRTNAAAVPGVNRNALHRLAARRPPIDSQRKIAAILSAYDDLIENNKRRIKILEEMARRVYHQWFVDFRYPGHDGDDLVPTELGAIPGGWKWRELREIAAEVRDAADPRSVPRETPYIGLEHMPRRSVALTEWDVAKDAKSRKYRFKVGDVLFGKIRPYFHKVVVPSFAGLCSTDAIVIRSLATEYAGLVLQVVSSDAFVQHAVQTSQGTKMPRANWAVLERYLVPVPPFDLLRRFNAIVADTVGLLHCFVSTNSSLARTRDLLLPRLISGELDVTDIDVAMWSTAP